MPSSSSARPGPRGHWWRGGGARYRVAATFQSGPELVELLHAAIRIGAALVPLDPDFSAETRDQLLERIEPSAVIVDSAELDLAAPASPELTDLIELDDPLCVISTSGSSGAPKLIELSCANHLWSAVGCGMRIGLRSQDRWLCCLPLHHVGGLSIAIRSAIYGSTAVVERFDSRATAATIGGGGITIVSLVATMLERLLDSGLEPGDLRCALLGGGPAPQGLIQRALDAGVPVAATYGLTEACSQVTTLAPEQARAKLGSAGPPLSPTRIRIGEDGRILVQGPTVARGEAGSDGRPHTGDLGRIDSDGHLYVLGRADEVIVTGGDNVSPEEVENVLLEHPAIADAAVFGRDDAQWQHAVIAAVVARGGQLPADEELRSYCRERLPGFKVPKSFEPVETLPRNAQGKLQRAELR